jgi:hypothetical protein
MTEHNKKIEQQRERLKTEALDNQVTALEIRAGRIQTWYESGAWLPSTQETSVRTLQPIIGGSNERRMPKL